MSLVLFFALSGLLLGLAYRLRSRALSRFFRLDPATKTPAHAMRDGLDFEPAKTSYLLPQHFSAISAAGPIAGPILAATLFGWLPSWLWIIIGAIFIGGVHDLATLVASVRHRGHSVAELANRYMSRRAYLLFLAFIWMALVYVIIAFTDITAGTFLQAAAVADAAAPGPAVASSSLMYLALAILMGLVMRRLGLPADRAKLVFIPLVFLAILAGPWLPLDLSRWFTFERPQLAWDYLLLAYCFGAALVPVWLLLQPRGDLGGYFLYIVLVLGVLGAVIGGLAGAFTIQAPPFSPKLTLFSFSTSGGGAPVPPLFPMLFITIACGACSGFHSIVAGGTTSKQLDREPDAIPVAYGGMLLEAFFACLSLAAFMVLETPALKPDANYAQGLSRFIQAATFGAVPAALALQFSLLCFATFVFDTLDASTRLARYILMELAGWKGWGGRIAATVLTVVVPAIFLSLPQVVADGKPVPMWLAFWNLFGSSNQLLAALALLVVTVWLAKLGWRHWLTLGPALFMTVMTIWSLSLMLWSYTRALAAGQAALLHHVQAAVTVLLVALALLLLNEVRQFIRWRRRIERGAELTIDTTPYLSLTGPMAYKEIVVNVRQHFNDTVAILYLPGDIYPEAVNDFAAQVQKALASVDARRVVMNMANVKFLSSMAIGQLIALHKKVTAGGGRVHVCGVNANLQRIFSLAGLDSLFEVFADEDRAVESFFR